MVQYVLYPHMLDLYLHYTCTCIKYVIKYVIMMTNVRCTFLKKISDYLIIVVNIPRPSINFRISDIFVLLVTKLCSVVE